MSHLSWHGGAFPQPKKRRELNETEPVIREWFELEFWPLYPRHEGKKAALEAANHKAATEEKRAFYVIRLNSQLPEYLRRKKESGQGVIPMGSTWFNQDRADDELNLLPESNSQRPRATAQDDYPEYVPLSGAGG